MAAANDALRFLLEVAALAAVAYWGFSQHGGAVQWALGMGAPIALSFLWVTFINPQGSQVTKDPVRLLLEIVAFGAAVAALVASERTMLAVVLGALVAAHLVFTFPLGQR